MEKENFKDVWNRLHHEYKKDSSNILNYDSWLDKYLKYIDSCNTDIIDLGCGSTGNNTLYLTEKNKSVIACDFAEEALDVIRKNIPNAKTMNFDMSKGIPFESETIELIIADLSLHYFLDKDTQNVINDIYRILKKDGILLVRLNSTSTTEFINLKNSDKKPLEENVYFNKDMIKRFFSKEDIDKYFSKFEILNCIEDDMNRFKQNKKIVWDCCFKKN